MNEVTILMPCFNCSKTLDRAIESIFLQTYKDWILFLCDDGSSDNTKGKIIEYGEKFPEKIKVFLNKENKGITYSLNSMIINVKTKYIARMDSDDIAENTRLEKQISLLENSTSYSFCGTGINKFDEEGIYSTNLYKELPDKKDFLWNSPFAHPTIVIKTDVLTEMNGYRDIKKTMRCEDYDLWFRLYEKGHRGYNIQEPLLEYYEGRNSYGKRKLKYRFKECSIRFDGYKRLKLYPIGIIYVIKPLIVGLIPGKQLNRIKRNLYGK